MSATDQGPPSGPDAHAPGVGLPPGATASTALLDLLRRLVDRFPHAVPGVSLPSGGKGLKAGYPALLARLEQRRVVAAERGAVATDLVGHIQETFRFTPVGSSEPRPLRDLAAGKAEPFPLAAPSGRGTAVGWRPECRYRGRTFEGAGLRALVDDLEMRHRASPEALACLRRALDRLSPEGRIDLSGERFALLGAGAEIAPTPALVAAGADVLWTDVRPPPTALLEAGGRLTHANGRGDLLTAPDRVLSSVRAFGEEGGGRPLHVGLFAYGPGRGREWRLGAAMNAVVRALPPEMLASVSLYISPTSPAEVSGVDRIEADRRLATRPVWQRPLLASGAITRCRIDPDLPRVSDTIVGVQGVSYQAAQWIEKTLAAEALRQERPGLRVSANVAPVTETRSLEHPLFRAAFRGAPIFGVESVPAEVTRTLNALMLIEDLLGDPPSGPRQLHGGLFAMPYALDSAIRVAALRGLAGPARHR